MQVVAEDTAEGVPCKQRRILVAIDDNRGCEDAVDWALREFYRKGDEINLIHILPPNTPAPIRGAPPVDFMPSRRSFDITNHELEVKHAQGFFHSRFLPKLQKRDAQYKLHILEGGKDADSIGNIISLKAVELRCVVVIMASQGKSKFQQFFLGSTTAFVSKSCKVPVLIVH